MCVLHVNGLVLVLRGLGPLPRRDLVVVRRQAAVQRQVVLGQVDYHVLTCGFGS